MSNLQQIGEHDEAATNGGVTKATAANQSRSNISRETDAEAERRRRRSSIAMDKAVRKMSVYRRLSTYAYSRKGSVANSVMDLTLASPTRGPAKLENTYQLQPADGQKFNASKVSAIVNEILKSYLDGEKYEEKKCKMMVKNLSDVIKSRVKGLGYPRYKIICSVTIGQVANQSLQFASRCLWSEDRDNFACGSYQSGTLFCTALVYGIYLD